MVATRHHRLDVAGLRENVAWFPRSQAYLRENTPPTLILRDLHDRYMPEAAARAYLRDLPGRPVAPRLPRPPRPARLNRC